MIVDKIQTTTTATTERNSFKSSPFTLIDSFPFDTAFYIIIRLNKDIIILSTSHDKRISVHSLKFINSSFLYKHFI